VEEIRGAKIITDALAAQPGVFLQQTTPGQGAAIIRGLKGSEVLHIVDGMRLNNAIFRKIESRSSAGLRHHFTAVMRWVASCRYCRVFRLSTNLAHGVKCILPTIQRIWVKSFAVLLMLVMSGWPG
jgi:hypothetical protein